MEAVGSEKTVETAEQGGEDCLVQVDIPMRSFSIRGPQGFVERHAAAVMEVLEREGKAAAARDASSGLLPAERDRTPADPAELLALSEAYGQAGVVQTDGGEVWVKTYVPASTKADTARWIGLSLVAATGEPVECRKLRKQFDRLGFAISSNPKYPYERDGRFAIVKEQGRGYWRLALTERGVEDARALLPELAGRL